MKLSSILAATSLLTLTTSTPIHLTNTTLDPRAGPHAKVTVALGNLKRNVGSLTGPALYGAIHNAVSTLCPDSNAKCASPDKDIKILVSTYNHGQINTANLHVHINRAEFGNNDSIRRLMIGTIAAAVQKHSEDAKNCHDFTSAFSIGQPQKKGRHCNIGDFVGVQVHKDGGQDYFLDANFQLKHKTDQDSKFDCVAGVQKINREVDKLAPEYGQVLAVGPTNVDKNVYCINKGVTK